jgi:hypothetical protein
VWRPAGSRGLDLDLLGFGEKSKIAGFEAHTVSVAHLAAIRRWRLGDGVIGATACSTPPLDAMWLQRARVHPAHSTEGCVIDALVSDQGDRIE